MKKLFSIMSNLQTHYHFKLDFQKVNQHTGGKWLIHGTKHRKDNQLHDEHDQSNIQRQCPGVETSREVRICGTRIT